MSDPKSALRKWQQKYGVNGGSETEEESVSASASAATSASASKTVAPVSEAAYKVYSAADEWLKKYDPARRSPSSGIPLSNKTNALYQAASEAAQAQKNGINLAYGNALSKKQALISGIQEARKTESEGFNKLYRAAQDRIENNRQTEYFKSLSDTVRTSGREASQSAQAAFTARLHGQNQAAAEYEAKSAAAQKSAKAASSALEKEKALEKSVAAQYTPATVGSKLSRVEELLAKDSWSMTERAEAAAALKAIDGTTVGNIVSDITGSGNAGYKWQQAKTENYRQLTQLGDLRNRLYNRVYSKTNALAQGIGTPIRSGIEGAVGAAANITGNENLKNASSYLYKAMEGNAAQAQKDNPGIYKAGSAVGSIATLAGIASGIDSIGALTKLPSVLRAAVSGAASFAGSAALQGAGAAANTSLSGVTPGAYGRSIIAAGAEGAAGGLAGGAVGKIGAYILQKAGLAGNSLANTALAGISSASFAGGNVGTQEVLRSLGYVQGEKASAAQIVKDTLVAFAFGALNYYLRSGENKAAAKDADVRPKSKYFDGIEDLDELRAARNELAKQYHSDVTGGSDEIMAEINAEYDSVSKWLLRNGVTRAAAAYEEAGSADTGSEEAQAANETLAKEVRTLQKAVDDGTISGEQAQEASQILGAVVSGETDVAPEETIPSVIQLPGDSESPHVGLASPAAAVSAPSAAPSQPAVSPALPSAEAVGEAASKFGENGAKAFTKNISAGTTLADYYGEFAKVYNLGTKADPNENITGSAVDSRLPDTPHLNTVQRFAAYASGMRDAASKAAEVTPVAENNTSSEQGAPAVMESAEKTAVPETSSTEAEKNPSIPETASTEAAEKKLVRGVSMPIQGKNEDALVKGLGTGNLTMDDVTLGGHVAGFNDAQRESLARQLIDGSRTRTENISIDVPYDGKFEINNTPAAVAQVLNGLNVKAIQDTIFSKALDDIMRAAKRTAFFKDGDNLYVTNGYLIVPADKDAVGYAMSEYKATMLDNPGAKGLNDTYTRLVTAPYSGKLGDHEVLAFNTPDGKQHIFNEKALKYLDGGRLYIGDNYGWLKATDTDGNVTGYLFPMIPRNGQGVDTTGKAPATMRSFSKKMQSDIAAETGKLKTRPAGAISESDGTAAAEKGASTGRDMQSPAGEVKEPTAPEIKAEEPGADTEKGNDEILAVLNPSEPDETAGLDDEEPDDGKDLLISTDSSKQEIKSSGTSINSAKLPVVFSHVEFKPGTVNLDIGGGRFDNATEFLASKGVKSYVYDPYNRTPEHNAEAAAATQEGQSDTVTISNVLNVIKEQAARDEVLSNAVDALKPDGTAYITIYEGDQKGVGAQTSKGWQENRVTANYIPEVRKYFTDVSVKNKVIIARGPKKAKLSVPVKNVVTPGMSDQQRYDVLKDRSLYAPMAEVKKISGITPGDYKALEGLAKRSAYLVLRKIGEQFGIFRGDYRNQDIDFEFEFTHKSLQESTNKQNGEFRTYADMMSVFHDVVYGAVGIEAHGDRYSNSDGNLSNFYVLSSAFKDGTDIVPVVLEIKEFSDGTRPKLYIAVTQTRIEKSGVVERTPGSTIAAAPRSVPASSGTGVIVPVPAENFGKSNAVLGTTIRLADLFANVNTSDGELLKYIPDGFLNAGQLAAKKEALAAEAAYTERRNAKFSSDNSVAVGGQAALWQAERIKGGTAGEMPLSSIIEKLRHDYGIPVTTGHIRGAKILGQYERGPQSIRSRVANDLPTIAHELGHHLDNTFGITEGSSPALKGELSAGLTDEMKMAYPKKKWTTEGLAEYVRRYLQNKDTAAIDYPQFTKYLRETLPADELKKLDGFADQINEYYSMDAGTATSAIHTSDMKTPDFRTGKEKAQDKADYLYQQVVDSLHAIHLFDKDAGTDVHKYAINNAYTPSRCYAMLTGDLYDYEGNRIGTGLKAALDGINIKDRKEWAEFGEYLVVRHGPEYMEQGKRVFADDRKNLQFWMKNRQAELEAQYPKFKAAAERLYKFQDELVRSWAIDTGLIPEEVVKDWREKYPNYVPFQRVLPMGRHGGGVKKGFANQTAPFHRAIGSGLDIIHPVESIINNMVKIVTAGSNNSVMLKLCDAAQMKSGLAGWMEQDPMPLKKTTADLQGVKDELRDLLADAGLTPSDEKAANEAVDSLANVLVQYSRGKAVGNEVTVLRDGKPEYWKINDPLLLSSISNINPARLPALIAAYGRVNRFIMSNVTGVNVVWSIFSNLPRDIGTWITYSENKNVFNLIGGIVSEYTNYLKGRNADPTFQLYKTMGGMNASAYTADKSMVGDIKATISGSKTKWLNPMEWFEYVGDMIEAGPRFAAFRNSLNAGKTPQEAFYDAMESTVNFRRNGTIGKQLNSFIPFSNAQIQSTDRFVRYFTGEDAPQSARAKTVRGRWIAFLLSSAGIAGALSLLNNRDDESKKNYAQLSNYTKNSYFCIPVGNGKYFCIPKPHEVAELTSFFERCVDLFAEKNKHAFDEFYQYTADNFLPNGVSEIAQWDWNGFLESFGIGGAIYGVSANRDFLGRPIVSQGLSNLMPKDQYNDRTSRLAYWFGQAFGLSPLKTDYFMQQVLGGFWKYQKALFPLGQENVDLTLGVKNQYLKDNEYSTDVINRLYDSAEKLSKEHASDKGNMDVAVEHKKAGTLTGFYSNYNALAKNLPDSDLNRGVRQTVIDMISEYQKSTESGISTAVEAEVESICKAAGTTEYMPAVMNPVVKDTEGNEYRLTAEEYVDYQTNYNRIYFEVVENSLAAAQDEDAAYRKDVLKAAKEQASTEATGSVLASHGKSNSDYDKWTSVNSAGVSDTEYILFKAAIDMANDDGSLKQNEVIDAINSIQGLSSSEKSALFGTRYSSNKNNPW